MKSCIGNGAGDRMTAVCRSVIRFFSRSALRKHGVKYWRRDDYVQNWFDQEQGAGSPVQGAASYAAAAGRA